MLSLWRLLTFVCFAAPFSGALAAAKHAKVGLGGYTLAGAVGLALGLSCAWAMNVAGAVLHARMKGQLVSRREWYFRALYFAAVLWIIVVELAGVWLSSALLRVVF